MYSSKTIRSIVMGKMVEICTIRFAFRANLSTSAIHRRCAEDPMGQIAERCQLQPATTSQIGRRDMRTRLYSFQHLKPINGLLSMLLFYPNQVPTLLEKRPLMTRWRSITLSKGDNDIRSEKSHDHISSLRVVAKFT